MDYSKLIVRKKQYKYSANICFDLQNEEKLVDFIPNKTTTEIIREYVGGIITGSTSVHSRILYGSYGTGKSHLLTVIGDVLGQLNSSSDAFSSFLKMISKYDMELSHDITQFVKKNKPYLIVPIYSEFDDFSRCISYSLKKALEEKGMNICFNGFFDEALSLLNKWSTRKESKSKLEDICRKNKVKIDNLRNGLAAYDSKYETVFNNVYEEMSYGATFNANSSNLLEDLEVVNKAIADSFSGIIIVFDEFGRYIEDNSLSVKVKQIQDLAEYCDHGNYSDYIILVSHKQLSMYTGEMQRTISDEWKKVEGRFKATSINVKYDQCLSLIEHIIPKSNKWPIFEKKYKRELDKLYKQAWNFKGFLLPPGSEMENPFEGCYPLHPITLYALDKLSKKVAQNERTIFTYLAGNEEFSLNSVLRKLETSDFHFIGLDVIFDYFDVNIKTYRTGDSYSVYKKLQAAFVKLGDNDTSLEKRILKAMAVIYIVADSEVLSATENTLIDVIDASKKEILEALNQLASLKIIRFMRQYKYYDFFDSSQIDLEGKVVEKLPSISEDMVVNILNEKFSDFVVYPYSYNAYYHIKRVFIPVFINRKDLEKKTFENSLPKYYDGIVGFVLDDRSQKENFEAIKVPDRMILLVNSKAKNIILEIKRYIAIEYFYSIKDTLAKEDPTITKEISLYLNEQETIINEMIEKWRNFDDKYVFSIYNGVNQKLVSEEELSNLASTIMAESFPHTLIVNNDILNKNVLSGAIKLARKKAVNEIIANDNIYSDCQPLSPEYNILRSVLSKNGISVDGTVNVDELNRLANGKTSGDYVVYALKHFLKKAELGKVSFNEIYEKLKEPPYGLRDGLLPVLLAFALKQYENISIYFHGIEHDYVCDELIAALEKPEDYTIYVTNWNKLELTYIENLEHIFSDYLSPNSSRNRLKKLFTAMNNHYSSVSKVARTTQKYVSTKTILYRKLLSVSYSDYNHFFFDVLPELSKDLVDLTINIKNIKLELENVEIKVRHTIEVTIREALDVPERQSTVFFLQEKYKNDWHNKRQKTFDYQTNAFLDYVSNLTDNENAFSDTVAKLFTGFEVEYWSDDTMEEFETEFTNVIAKIQNYKAAESLDSDEEKITIELGLDKPIVSRFKKQNLSLTGETLYNKLNVTIKNFGESITLEEKINIITRILKENL